jgi:hypothetical protein
MSTAVVEDTVAIEQLITLDRFAQKSADKLAAAGGRERGRLDGPRGAVAA